MLLWVAVIGVVVVVGNMVVLVEVMLLGLTVAMLVVTMLVWQWWCWYKHSIRPLHFGSEDNVIARDVISCATCSGDDGGASDGGAEPVYGDGGG